MLQRVPAVSGRFQMSCQRTSLWRRIRVAAAMLGLGMIICGIGATAAHAANPDDEVFFSRLAKRVEPNRIGRPDRLDFYISYFRQQMVNDPRLFAFHVDVEYDKPHNRVALRGYIELSETHVALHRFLDSLGFHNQADHIVDLPAKKLGSKRYGLVRTTHSFCYNQPAGTQEVVTDCLLGEPLYLLDSSDNGYLLCHSADGYIGFIHADDVQQINAKQFQSYQSGEHACLTRDIKTSDIALPVGANLKCVESSKATVQLQLPSGTLVAVPRDACHVVSGKVPGRLQHVLKVARGLLETPYLWGGKTSSGIDCSGLVQTAFAAEGVWLPRDSSQQVYLGRLTATRWQRKLMRPGDTLYFVGHYGKIRHTALYLGGGRYIEAAGGKVRISSMVPGTDGYDPRRSGAFVFAKRLLD